MLGIISQELIQHSSFLFFCLGLTCLFFCAPFGAAKMQRSLVGFFLLVSLFCLSGGLVDTKSKQAVNPDLYFGRHPVLLHVGNEIRPGDDGFRFHGRIRAFKPINDWIAVDLSVWVRLRTNTLKPLPGDLLLVRGKMLEPIENPLPLSFNMDNWLTQQGYSGIWHIADGDAIHLGKYGGWFITAFGRTRAKLLSNLKKNGLPDHAHGLVSALILGERSEIDPEIQQAFRVSGLVHILAVSGMHVALVFGLFSLLLKPLRNMIVKSLFLLLGIWLYALLSGLSPSVTRAAVLYSLIIMADVLQRKNASGLNSLIAAGVLMLLADTHYLYDLGFQLSFLAVFGIVTLGSRFDFSKVSRWKQYLLQAMWVSAVAQMATMPVLLYHFGTFPVYFLPANLIAVPFSALLTYLSIASLVLSPVPHLGLILCEILSVGIEAFTACVSFFAWLPNAQIEGLVPNVIQSILLSLFVFRLLILPISLIKCIKLCLTILLCWPVAGKILPNRRLPKEPLGLVRAGEVLFLTRSGSGLYWQSRTTDLRNDLAEFCRKMEYPIQYLPSKSITYPFVLRIEEANRLKTILLVNTAVNPFIMFKMIRPDSIILLGSSRNRRIWEYACLRNGIPANIGMNTFSFRWF